MENMTNEEIMEFPDFYEICKENDAKILDLVKSLVDESYFSDITEYLEDSDDTYNYSIEDKPKGDYQEECDYEFIKGSWVNQTVNGGYTGEEFQGTVSIPLPNGKYFQFHYSM